jgi:hypothetical protein
VKTILFVLFAAYSAAQSISLSVAPAMVSESGGSATLTLTFADAVPTANVAGLEWTLTLPAGVTAGAATIGAASMAAGKVLTCGTTVPPICVLIGDGTTLNEAAIASGVLATMPLTVAASTVPGSLSILPRAVLGTTGPGMAVSIAASTINLVVDSEYDLNGDGVVNAADVAIMASEADGSSTCSAPSTGVGDGKCGLIDVELEILAALGVIH